MKRAFCLSILLFFTALSGQNKTPLPKDPAGHPKLIVHQSADSNSNLSHNVHCSLRDRAGHLWFGTTGNGVYRFDGKLFINFTTKDGLRDNGVYSILEDKAGNIWFGTKAGACFYNGKTFTNVSISDQSHINPGASVLLQDKSGKIWFGAAGGVYYYDGRSFTHFPEKDAIVNKSGLQFKMTERMLEDRNGNIWFGSGMTGGEGICLYDGKSIVNFRPNGDVWIPYMMEDKDGNIWFSGRNHGNFRYDGKRFTDFTEQNGFNPIVDVSPAKICLAGKVAVGPMLQDKAGNIWFTGKTIRAGGEGGIWRYDGRSCVHFAGGKGMDDLSIWCMTEDNAGNIWIGTNDTGLYRLDGKTFSCFSEKVVQQ
jgi:ligand-binding sensor domain-containing protein